MCCETKLANYDPLAIYLERLRELGYEYKIRARRHLFQPNVADNEQLVYIPNNEFWLLMADSFGVAPQTEIFFHSDIDSLHCTAGEFKCMGEAKRVVFGGDLSIAFANGKKKPAPFYINMMVVTPIKRPHSQGDLREHLRTLSKCSCQQ